MQQPASGPRLQRLLRARQAVGCWRVRPGRPPSCGRRGGGAVDGGHRGGRHRAACPALCPLPAVLAVALAVACGPSRGPSLVQPPTWAYCFLLLPWRVASGGQGVSTGPSIFLVFFGASKLIFINSGGILRRLDWRWGCGS